MADTAKRFEIVWDEDQNPRPSLFHHGDHLGVVLASEYDCLRAALEQILGHFIPGRRNTYAPANETLDMIRAEVEEALLDV